MVYQNMKNQAVTPILVYSTTNIYRQQQHLKLGVIITYLTLILDFRKEKFVQHNKTKNMVP